MNSRLWRRMEIWFLVLLLTALPAFAQTNNNDGQIVFVCIIENQRDICVVNPDGSGLLRLTDTVKEELRPTFSPDCTQVAFLSQPIRSQDYTSSTERVSHEIYVMRSDGSNLHQITFLQEDVQSLNWSPDGTQIAYHVFDATTTLTTSIWTIGVNSGVQRQLFDGYSEPRWSPDGSQLAITQQRAGGDLYLTDANGTYFQQITDDEAWNMLPRWSPDGSQIVFSSRVSGRTDLYIVDVDTYQVRQLTDSEDHEYVWAWSPDGLSLLLSIDLQNGLTFQLYLLNMEENNIRPLFTDDNVMAGWGADWSATSHVSEVAPPVTLEENLPAGLWMESWSANERVCRSSEQRRSFLNRPFLLTITPHGDEITVRYLLTGEAFSLPRTEPDFYYGALTGNGGEAFGESHVAWLTHMEYAFLERFNENCFIFNSAAWDFVTDGAYCTLTALGTPNLRSGPGTTFQRVGTLSMGEDTIAITQATGEDGYVWYQLYDNKWVRSDVVEAESTCADLPSR